jgi:cytochrome P450
VGAPDLYQRVQADPSVVALAVEESLRLDSPTMMQGRRLVTDCQVGEAELQAGDRVVLGLASANRDEKVFERSEEFDIERPNLDDHVAFGGGAHFCPGAPLARLEGRVAVTTFLARVASASLRPGFQCRKWPIHWANGPQELPITVHTTSPRRR